MEPFEEKKQESEEKLQSLVQLEQTNKTGGLPDPLSMITITPPAETPISINIGSSLAETQPMTAVALVEEEMPIIGQTNRTILWSVLLVAFLILAGMVTMVSKGALAMSAAVPVPFTVKAGTLKGANFHLFPGISQADKSTPVGINTMDCTIANLEITKTISLPVVGNITITMKAGANSPAVLNGLTTDVASLSAGSANFQTLSLNTNENGNAFELDSPSATLNNAAINSPFLVVNNITLPDLSFSIGR